MTTIAKALEKETSKKKQRIDTKKDAKRIKNRKKDKYCYRNIRNLNDWMAP